MAKKANSIAFGPAGIRVVQVARITIYPFKSFDGLALEEAAVLPTGWLENDRRFALVTEDGQVVNGKATNLVHHLVFQYHPQTNTLALSRRDRPTEPVTFHLSADRDELELWLSEYFGLPVTIIENRASGFPDDAVACGPTFISTGTLQAVASWFPPLDLDEVRRRFRANIELETLEGAEAEAFDHGSTDSLPFWEDCLFGPPGEVVRFRVGETLFEGTNPCARCPVPMRNSLTGEFDPLFGRTFIRQRQATLPSWVDLGRFDHFYRLAINTRPVLPVTGTAIRVGDVVEILGRRPE